MLSKRTKSLIAYRLCQAVLLVMALICGGGAYNILRELHINAPGWAFFLVATYLVWLHLSKVLVPIDQVAKEFTNDRT